MNFAEETLGGICDRVGGMIRTGPFGSQLHSSDYVPDGIPVVMPKNIADGRVSAEDIARVRPDDVLRLSQHILHKGDIVYGRRGDIGRHALITRREEGWLCGTGCMRVSLGDQVVYPEYLHYYLNQQAVTTWIANQAVGATMPNLNTDILRSVPVRYPHQAIQRKIVSILSAYDDLIENNLRRIAVLEEMARTIYREWFVEFRYPGRGSEPLVESEAGLIPRNWEAGPIGSLVETMGGGTPSTSKLEYWENGSITWYTPSDLTASNAMFITSSSRKITELGLRSSSAKLFPPYSVMMTSRATIGVVSIATTEACTNQGFITCIPNDRVSSYHLYFWLLDNRQMITSLASGATFKEINKTVFRQLPIAVPPEGVAEAFTRMVSPVAGLVEVLLKQNTALHHTRDLLLPRLISGELDVSNITIDTEEDEL